MISALHWFLALASAAVLTLAGVEASLRAVQNRQPGRVSAHLSEIVLLLLGVTAASGLGMFLGGAHPHEGLHFLYALLAFAAIPATSVLMGNARPRARALATAISALIGLVLVVRLFMTG
jgi:hypothetical protein